MPQRRTPDLSDDREEAPPPLSERLLRNARGIILAVALTLAAAAVLLASIGR